MGSTSLFTNSSVDKSSSGLFDAERQRELLPAQPVMNSPGTALPEESPMAASRPWIKLADENHARQHPAQMRGVGDVVNGKHDTSQREHRQ